MNITQPQVNELVARIEPYGYDIRESAEKGDKLCESIMAAYETFYHKTGSKSLGVLQDLMDDYEGRLREICSERRALWVKKHPSFI